MHLPDGLLSVPVSGALIATSAGAVGAAVRRVAVGDRAEDARLAPLLGVVAAFVFVAQMFNFPIASGTTGHLLGAALTTALFGPWRAILVMAVVIAIQAFLFADGGVLALGANVFNMGVSGCLVAALVLPAGPRWLPGAWGRSAALAIAAWLSVVVAAGLTALELGVSGTVPLRLVVPAMLGVHAVIGVGEAVLSVAAYNLLVSVRAPAEPAAPWAFAGSAGTEPWRLAAVLAVGLVGVRLAFPSPDGLESVAEAQRFAEAAREAFAAAPLPDYTLPGREAAGGFDWLGNYLSAALGMGLCGLLMFAIGGGRRRTAAADETEP